MKKIWQKSLASMVSAALCLTAFVGCLTVNAATDYTGTITSEGVAVATTATEAKLDVAVSVSIPNGTPGIAYTGLKATTEFGTLKGVEIKSGDVKVEELSTDGVTSIPAIDENGSFIIAAKDTSVGVNNYVLTLTFAKNASVELVDGATYPVTISYLGSKDVGAANWNEDPIGFNVAVKDITVTAATIQPEKINVTYAHSLALESKILVNMYVPHNDKLDQCENLYMVCTKSVYVNGVLTDVPKTLEIYNRSQTIGNTTYYWFVYDDIAAKEFGCTFTSTIYGTDAAGNRIYESANADSYSCLTYAANKISNAKYKSLISAMLVYCSAAQNRFSYDVGNLVKNDARVAGYIESVEDLNDLVNSKSLSGTGFSISNSLSLESTVELTFAFLKSETGLTTQEEMAASNYKVVIYDEAGTTVLKTFNATDIVSYGANYWCVNYSDLAAKEFNKVITCKVFNGDTQVSATEQYSIESYAASQCAKDTITETQRNVLQAMMKYSRAAVAYFAN